EQMITANNKNESVRVLGWKDNVHDLLRGYDVFVLPSLWEGMPLAILEAQASGLPCIVSDIPGNNHLVLDSDNGFLFKSND
ncbi:glycosyltransferase, partial [Escherichia coli]|nr:glycosyltransferase [Escherichia coli]